MVCEQCQKNEATIFLTQVCEGETTRSALCATCGAPLIQHTVSPEQLGGWLQSGQTNAPFPFPTFDEVADSDPHYPREAFLFVRDGVNHAVRSHPAGSLHVTVAELLDALRALAIEKYGPNAREQLRSWGVTRCQDFGQIVFTLIERGVFGKRPEDKIEYFEDGYDFTTAFPVATT
jgi:uncharacterized repeat protein (TIGR04138 family)